MVDTVRAHQARIEEAARLGHDVKVSRASRQRAAHQRLERLVAGRRTRRGEAATDEGACDARLLLELRDRGQLESRAPRLRQLSDGWREVRKRLDDAAHEIAGSEHAPRDLP